MNNLPIQDLPLRDIHLPEAVSWWPPAAGWWILLATLLLSIVSVYMYKKYKHKLIRKTPYKKRVLKEFKHIKQQFGDDQSTQLLRALSTLMRKVMLGYFPRQEVASLTGAAWLEQINKLSRDINFNDTYSQLLLEAPYREHVDFNADELLNIFEQWLKQLPDKVSGEQSL